MYFALRAEHIKIYPSNQQRPKTLADLGLGNSQDKTADSLPYRAGEVESLNPDIGEPAIGQTADGVQGNPHGHGHIREQQPAANLLA